MRRRERRGAHSREARLFDILAKGVASYLLGKGRLVERGRLFEEIW